MPIKVNVEGLGVVNFPDGTSPEEIDSVLRTEVPKAQRQKLSLEREVLQRQRIGTDILEKGIGVAEQALGALEPISPSGILNQPARIYGKLTGKPVADPFRPGEAAIAEIPEPKGTSVLAGIGKVGARLGNMLQSPESLVSLPGAMASAPLRALFAADMARHFPEQVTRSYQTLRDPESTPANVTAAVLEPAATAGLVGLGLRQPRTRPGPPIDPSAFEAPPLSPVRTISPGFSTLPPLGRYPTFDPSGLRMAPESPPPTPGEIVQASLQREPIKMTSEPLPAPAVETPPPPTGGIPLRSFDFKKAVAERVSQEQQPPVHPNKPLTDNQIRIIRDSLEAAIVDNQIPGPRKGLISGSELEKWADNAISKAPQKTFLGGQFELAAAAIVKGAALIERGATTFTQWSAEMLKQFGDGIKPHLRNIYDQSVEYRIKAFSNATLESQEKGPNAIQPETAQVLRPVRPQPVEGEPTVPVERAVEGDVARGGEAQLSWSETPKVAAAPEATSIKNATVDAERQARGLPPAMEPTRRTFGDVWDQSMARIDQDPTYPDRLVSELSEKPRAITDLEDATLLRRQVELQNEYTKAAKDLADANDAGNAAAISDNMSRLSNVSDQLLNLYNVNKAVGTETGRGLNARKMMANEEYTLSKMELDRRVAKGGRKLTADERAELVALNKKIARTQKAYDDYVAKTEKRVADLEARNDPRTKSIVDRIVQGIEREAAAARNRLKERGVVFGSGPLHELPNIRDYAIIGASHIARGALDFARWSKAMVGEFGEKINPHLKAIYDESNKYLDEQATVSASPTEAPKVKSALAGKKVTTPIGKEGEKLDFEQAKAKAEWQKTLFDEQMKQRTALQKSIGAASETLNTSRAIITSADLSAVLRQGGFITVAHPVRAAKAFPAMFEALKSEAGQHAVNQRIAKRENFPAYMRSGLYLAEHGKALSKMEEAYMSRWADKIPGVSHSQRAYVAFLNQLRADSFDAMKKSLSKDGTVTPEAERAISNFINVATGRGSLPGGMDAALANLNTYFFAPRYVTSRFQLLAGQPFYRGTAGTRKLIAGEYARYLVGMGVIYGLAKMSLGDDGKPAEVGTDPTSTDFGKIRIGNTRIDPMSGLSQTAVFTTREGEQLMKTLRGEKRKFGERGGAELLGRFLRTKLAPVPGLAVDIFQGENVVGEKVTPASAVQSLTVPLGMRDIYEALQEQGVEKGAALALLSIFGMGLQTYEARTNAPAKTP